MFKLFKSNEVKSVVQEGMTLEQVRLALLLLMAQQSINHHRMGQLYNYVVKNKLAEKAGYKNAQAWFSQHLVNLSYATLKSYGAVAAAFSEEAGRRFGVTCLSLLLTYEEAADMEANREEPGATLIEVPGEHGHVASKPFSQCSVDEMRRALQRKRKPASSKPLPPGAVELGEQYHAAVTARFSTAAPIQVQVRNHKGKPVVDFKGIPLEQVSKLVEALSGELPPVPKMPRVEKRVPVA